MLDSIAMCIYRQIYIQLEVYCLVVKFNFTFIQIICVNFLRNPYVKFIHNPIYVSMYLFLSFQSCK